MDLPSLVSVDGVQVVWDLSRLYIPVRFTLKSKRFSAPEISSGSVKFLLFPPYVSTPFALHTPTQGDNNYFILNSILFKIKWPLSNRVNSLLSLLTVDSTRCFGSSIGRSNMEGILFYPFSFIAKISLVLLSNGVFPFSSVSHLSYAKKQAGLF